MKTMNRYPSDLKDFTDRQLRTLAGELFTIINWGSKTAEVLKQVDGIEYTEVCRADVLKKKVNQEITRRHELKNN